MYKLQYLKYSWNKKIIREEQYNTWTELIQRIENIKIQPYFIKLIKIENKGE